MYKTDSFTMKIFLILTLNVTLSFRGKYTKPAMDLFGETILIIKSPSPGLNGI